MTVIRMFNRNFKSIDSAAKRHGIPKANLEEFVELHGPEGDLLEGAVEDFIKKNFKRKGENRPPKTGSPARIMISINGVEYATMTAAAGALGVSVNGMSCAVKKHGPHGEGLDTWASTYKRKLRGKPVAILGDTFGSLTVAAEKLGIDYRVVQAIVAKNGRSGDDLDRAVEKAIKSAAPIKWSGSEYSSLRELEADLGNPFISLAGLRAARFAGELDHYLKAKTKKAARHTVNGVVYKNIMALVREFGLKENVTRDIYANGGTFEEIVTHLRPDVEIVKRARQYRGNAGRPVTMSGWTWASRRAFFIYYGVHRNQGVKFDDPRGVAVQAEPMLIRLYQRRALLENNRLRPDLEAKVPSWALPLDQPRSEPLNRWDILLTPDWHHMANTGTRHAFHTVHERTNFEKMIEAEIESAQSVAAAGEGGSHVDG